MMEIREARESCGWTQEELGEATGIDQAAISRMENGKQRITIDQLQLIAEALGVSVKRLISDRAA